MTKSAGAPVSAALPLAANESSSSSPDGGDERARQLVRAIIIGPVLKQDLGSGKTKEAPPDDLLTTLTSDGKVIDPPFDKLMLAMLPEQSTTLAQVIEAMVQNIDGFGYRFECRVNTESPDCSDEMKRAVAAEKAKLLNFFSNCCVDYSFTEMRKRARQDIETTGEGYWEVIRAPATKEIIGLNHISSHQIRLGLQGQEFTPFKRKMAIAMPDGSVKLEEVTHQKRFRLFVQARLTGITRALTQSRGYDVRWFKEFGDPRVIDNLTGEVVSGDKLATFPEEQKAGELLHWKLYSARTPYGLPRHIGNLITIFGDRASDEINFTTLKNNNIPSMLVLVSNGQLTEGSIKRIEEFTETQIQGSSNYSRFLLIEGEGQFEGSDHGHVKIDAKPLTSEQMRDQLFQEYGKNNGNKIRECYRLPPIFVGRSDDYTRATAEASRKLADEQVFRPERDEEDSIINKLLMPEMDIKYHTFKSNGPNVTDDTDLINILTGAERGGGLTPRIARLIVADVLGRDELPPLSPDVDPDVPFSLQLAEAVKNNAPNVQANLGAVTKMAGAITGEDILKALLGLRSAFDEELAVRARDQQSDKG